MKKRIVLFAIMLSTAALPASAFDVSIAGRPYPVFVFIPLALILFVWLVIVFKWIFRNFGSIALFFYNIGRFVSSLGVRMGVKKLKEEIEEKEEEIRATKAEGRAKEEITRDLTPFIEKINAIEKKLEKAKDGDAIFRELSAVIKDFFRALLSIHYEFTDEEMVGVLEKKKKHLVDFAQRISELKFSGNKITQAQAEELVKEFKSIVHKYVETGWKPKRIARGVIERLAEQDKKILGNVKQYVGFLKGESRKKEIEGLLEDEQEILKRNISSMKRAYNKILRMYVQLTPNEKAVVYPQLIAFYKNANKAIFSSVYGEKSRKELEYFVKELQRLKGLPKMEPWLARLKAFFSSGKEKAESKEKPVKGKVPAAPKASPEKKKLPSIKPLIEALAGMFRPEDVSKKQARKMLALKAPKLREPSLKPLAEKFSALKDSAKKMFSRIPTKPVKVSKEELAVPQPSKGAAAPSAGTISAIEKIGKMLEQTPAIEQVDYSKKLQEKISRAWNLIAAADFDAFEQLQEQIKLDYVNLSGREKEVMEQRMRNLFESAEKAKADVERRKKDKLRAEEQGRKAEELLQDGIRAKEREKAQAEARAMAAELERQMQENEEIEKEEEILHRLEWKRKQKEMEAGIAREQREIKGVLREVQGDFREADELEHEEELLQRLEAERKEREARAYTLKEKSHVRAALRQVDRLFRERQKLELESIARERRIEAQKKRIEALEKKKVQQQLLPEVAKVDTIFRKQPEIEELKKRREEEIAERRLRREIQEQIRRDRLVNEREAGLLKREEEKRRAELDKRKKIDEKLRAEKEKEWKKSMHGKSLASLEELQNQLRSMIVGMERQALPPKESFREKLAMEAEAVRKEVEEKRAAELKKIKEKPAERKKKTALSPLEEEQLKLILELERINKGL